MARKTFTVVIEVLSRDPGLLPLMGPGQVARAVRDFVEASMAPGSAVEFRVQVSSEAGDEPPVSLPGRILSLEELAERLRQERQGEG